MDFFTYHFRRLPEELPPPPGTRAANGYEERPPRPEPLPGSESYSSSYSSYYDRFYSKLPSNGSAPGPARPGASLSAGRGGPGAPRGAAAVAAAAAARKQQQQQQQQDQQSLLQTGPIYF